MQKTIVTRREFLADRQGRTFADVLNDPEQPFAEVLDFFNDEARQRRMEESEIHHDRPPLAGVVRELESLPAFHDFLCSMPAHRSKRLRQAVGVVVRMIMERRGWKKTGKKGSLGVRKVAPAEAVESPCHNSGGLSLWFLRAECYTPLAGDKFPSVRERALELKQQAKPLQGPTKSRRTTPSNSAPRLRRAVTNRHAAKE
jgi:hypothetical protein